MRSLSFCLPPPHFSIWTSSVKLIFFFLLMSQLKGHNAVRVLPVSLPLIFLFMCSCQRVTINRRLVGSFLLSVISHTWSSFGRLKQEIRFILCLAHTVHCDYAFLTILHCNERPFLHSFLCFC